MKGKRLKSLLSIVSKNKLFVPFIFASGYNNPTQMNLVSLSQIKEHVLDSKITSPPSEITAMDVDKSLLYGNPYSKNVNFNKIFIIIIKKL